MSKNTDKEMPIIGRIIELLKDEQIETRGRGVIIMCMFWEQNHREITPKDFQSKDAGSILYAFRDTVVHHSSVFEPEVEHFIYSGSFGRLQRRNFIKIKDVFDFIRMHADNELMSDDDWNYLLTMLDVESLNLYDKSEISSYWKNIGVISEVLYSLLQSRKKRITLLLNLAENSEKVVVKSLALWLLVADNAPMLPELLSRMISDTNATVRRVVATALGRCEDERALGLLKILMVDDSISVRLSALNSFPQIDSLESLDHLDTELKSTKDIAWRLDIIKSMLYFTNMRNEAVDRLLTYILGESDAETLDMIAEVIINVLRLRHRTVELDLALYISNFCEKNDIDIIAQKIKTVISKW